MTVYTDIQSVLNRAVSDADIGAHGRFWLSLTRDQFLTYKVFGQVALIKTNADGTFDPEGSHLVEALEGRLPFGKDQGVGGAKYNRMPSRRPAVSEDDIRLIREWIANRCP